MVIGKRGIKALCPLRTCRVVSEPAEDSRQCRLNSRIHERGFGPDLAADLLKRLVPLLLTQKIL